MSMQRTRPDRLARCIWAALALAAASASVRAADVPTDDLESITVYARRLTPVARVAASVTVLDQVGIERTLSSDVKELVRYEPGLTVRSDPFRFGLDTFSVRGLGGNRVAVEIDGIPAASGFAVGSYADTGRSFLDLAFVQRIEFLRGPASSLYGSDAIGGVVAMTSVQPADLLQGQRAAFGLRSEAGYAGVDGGWHVAALAALTAGPGDLLLGYVRREGHEPDTAANVNPDPRDYTGDSVLLKYRLGALDSGPLTLSVEGGQVRQDTSVDAFLGVGRFAATTRLVGDDRAQRYRVSLDQSMPAGRGFDGLDWRVYLQGTSTRQDSFETRRAVPPRTPPLQIDRQFHYDVDTVGAEATVVDTIESGRLRHDLVYGFEASRSRIDELRNGQQTNLTNGSVTQTILGETLPARDLPLTDVTAIGVFAQDELTTAGARWSVIPALRLDDYRLSPQSDRIYREDNPSTRPVALHEVSFAPKLGVTWRFTETLGGFFQYAHGFRSPPPEDVNIGLEIPLFNVRAIPNPDLKAEKSNGYELGLRWRTSLVNLTTSVYDNEYRDFIESKVNLGPDPDTGVTLFQSQNVARARIYGAELNLTLNGGAVTGALEGWTGRLAVAWSRGTDLEQDAPLNSVDPPSAVLGLRYDARSGRWGTEWMLTAVEAKTRVDDTPVDLYQSDGYATLDWVAHVQLRPGLTLNAGVFNLADARYIEWADVRGRAVGDPLIPYYTRPGRNASPTLHWSF